MKTLYLTADQARFLALHLEQNPHGYDVPNLRKLDKLLSVIEQAVVTVTENDAYTELTIELEDAHCDLVRTVWTGLGPWRATAREQVFAITDALEETAKCS